jgi:hypothetical protein
MRQRAQLFGGSQCFDCSRGGGRTEVLGELSAVLARELSAGGGERDFGRWDLAGDGEGEVPAGFWG